MDARYSVAVYMITDDTMGAQGPRSHRLAGIGDAEAPTAAVATTRYVGNHHCTTPSAATPRRRCARAMPHAPVRQGVPRGPAAWPGIARSSSGGG